MKKENSKMIFLRVSQEEFQKIRKLAKEDCRPYSQYIRKVILDHVNGK